MFAQLPLVLALLAALLLPSCGPWYIGERIRYDSELHVGAAIKHASVHYYDCKPESFAWMKADPGHRSIGEPSYVLAPEVTYRIRRPILSGIWDRGGGYTITDITPTGRMVLVKPHGRWKCEFWDNELVTTLPEGICADPQSVPADKPFDYDSALDLGDFDTAPATRGSLGAQIAAAPFDYVIDPALSTVTLSPLLAPAVAIGGAVVVIATPIWLTRRLFGDRQALPPWKYHLLLP